MKKYLCLFFVLFTATSIAQELVSSIPLDLTRNRDVFQVVNESNKNVTLFLTDKTTINAVRLNEKMQILDSLSVTRPEKKFTSMVGHTTNEENNSRIFWATSNRKEFYVQNFNFTTRAVTTENFNLTFKNEELVQEFSTNENFYLMSIVKKSNELKLYCFDSKGSLSEKKVNLDAINFFNYKNELVTFYAVLNQNLAPFQTGKLQFINTDNLVSLTESAKKRKCYLQSNKIIFSLDLDLDYTQIVTVDLNTLVAESKMFKKPFIDDKGDMLVLNSNSFLIDDKVFQIKSSVENFYLTIKNMQDEVLNQFHVSKDEPITFNNTEVIQENGDPGRRRVLEKNSQFLRKVTMLNSGVSCYKLNDKYILTVGSVSEESNNAMFYGAMFGVAGVIIAAAISNPTYDSFNAYSNRKVIYTNGLFDLNGKHLEGQIAPFAFDKIREYLDQNKNLDSKTIYKLDANYYLGYYNKADKNYSIRKFQD
jgi:hypothetical protein